MLPKTSVRTVTVAAASCDAEPSRANRIAQAQSVNREAGIQQLSVPQAPEIQLSGLRNLAVPGEVWAEDHAERFIQ